MDNIQIKSYFEVKTKPVSTWHVDYIDTLSGGCCGVPTRQTITLVQKKKPTQTQVENALNKSKGENV